MDEVPARVRHIRTKTRSHHALPPGSVRFVEVLLDVARYVLAVCDVERVQSLGSTAHGMSLHLGWHVSLADDGFAFQHCGFSIDRGERKSGSGSALPPTTVGAQEIQRVRVLNPQTRLQNSGDSSRLSQDETIPRSEPNAVARRDHRTLYTRRKHERSKCAARSRSDDDEVNRAPRLKCIRRNL